MSATLSPRGRRTVTALRLAAQGIARPASTTVDPVEVVRSMLAMQAQDYLGALWSLGLRTGADEAAVEAAHTSGAIVRSWPMRGTLHLVAAEDLGWMLSLTGERMVRMTLPRHRELQLTASDFERAGAIARERLAGGGRCSRAELLEAFSGGGVSVEGQRGIHLLGHLAHTGLLVLSGRTEYALLDEHVREPRRFEPQDAADELAVRYFHGHGPATVKDLAWWSGMPITFARAATERVRDRLDELVVDGVVHYLRPGLEPAAAGVHLLPGFDEYLLGYGDRSAALAPEHANAIVPGGNGLFLPTIVSRGDVLGTWRRERGKKALRLELAPFEPLPATVERGAMAAAKRYAKFVGLPLD